MPPQFVNRKDSNGEVACLGDNAGGRRQFDNKRRELSLVEAFSLSIGLFDALKVTK
jgi:hypothetical protein